MLVRIRIPELLARPDGTQMTPYALHKASGGRISMSTAYRLKRRAGCLESFESELLEALCDVFDIAPGELIERGKTPPKARRR